MATKTIASTTGSKAGILAVAVCIMLSSCSKQDDFKEDAPQMFSIGGTVTKSDGGAAAGASVTLENTADGSSAGESPVSASGEYVITGVGAGSYKITVTLTGYEPGFINEIKVIGADVTVDAVVLQKISVPTYALAGTVTKPDGSTAAGASVQVRTTVDNTLAGPTTTTDASGAYRIDGIPAGNYSIVATLDGYEAGILPDITVNSDDLTALNIVLQIVLINANAVSIIFKDNDATVDNLPSDGSVTATKDGAHVTIASSATKTVEYAVSGSTANGSLKIQNNAAAPNTLRIILNSAAIASASKLPPIQVTKNEGVTVVELKGNSVLSDHSSNEENAALISKSGSLELEGYGRLTVTGAAKHAVASSKKSITVRGGDITVPSAASDGFHAEDGFEMSGGSLAVTALGDGIDAGIGTAILNGGNIRIDSRADDTKGIKADGGITVRGGGIEMTVAGVQSKGISSKSDITIGGGDISIVTSGATALEPVGSGYDPSYCTAIKSDGNIMIASGTVRIESRSTADGGKGLSADGDITVSGGALNITTAGDGKVYTTEAGQPDSYTATCIKSDRNISLLGGQITCHSSGAGGKGINADGTLIIGIAGANNANLMLTVGTSGERFLVSGSAGGGQGGRPGGGFGDNGTDYANPKAIKSEGDMTLHSGTLVINCTQKAEGGEGLESKQTLTVNGGNINIHTYDDCINAATALVINGGNLFCAASGQDAIDSNGPLTVNGGLTIANGVRGDGEAFDAERNFQVNGGIIVGTHGGMSMTSPAGSQRSVRIQAAAGSALGIKNAAGDALLLFNIPVISGATAGVTVVVVFSDPRLVAGSYTLLTGGSISGGTSVNGYNTGGTYAGGTSKAFTL
jgi:hypothetical protein